MREIIKNIANYIRVGAFPNIMTIPHIVNATEDICEGRTMHALGNAMMVVFWASAGLGKYLVYTRIKEDLEKKGFDERIIKPKSYSWCDRHAINQAVKQTGYLEEYEAFLEREGHKWYHFIPKFHRFREVR